MISVEEAENLIFENSFLVDTIDISLMESYGTILRENIIADRNNPPFNRATMDGIAINYQKWEEGLKSFKIQGIQKAGQKQQFLTNLEECYEIMTGAPVPQNCDCVIRIEDIEIKDNTAFINSNINISRFQNIHFEGSDYKTGDVLIKEDTKILSVHAGVIASVGKKTVKVSKELSFAVVSTGDELIEPGKDIENHQIYISNSYALANAIKSLGYKNVNTFHLVDDIKVLKDEMEKILNNFDIIILSGGVSMGKFDYLPQVLNELNVEKIFHKITQKPGKPMWYGRFNNKYVFALPGNPVSSLICFYRYIKPFINKITGLGNNKEYVVLGNDFNFKTALTCFQPVKINNIDGTLYAQTVDINTSGDYASLVKSDGFIELPKDESFFKKGYIANFYRW